MPTRTSFKSDFTIILFMKWLPALPLWTPSPERKCQRKRSLTWSLCNWRCWTKRSKSSAFTHTGFRPIRTYPPFKGGIRVVRAGPAGMVISHIYIKVLGMILLSFIFYFDGRETMTFPCKFFRFFLFCGRGISYIHLLFWSLWQKYFFHLSCTLILCFEKSILPICSV